MGVVFRQQRARWTAKMARVRLSSRAPWEQERRIVGMVASPVENLSIVLLKLDRPVQLSDFVRSVCVLGGQLGELGEPAGCVGLGWDSQQAELRLTSLSSLPASQCGGQAELSTGSVCMEEEAGSGGCGGEMMAGHGLLCPTSPGSGQWFLAGVSAWRRGCGKQGQRPRVYEVVAGTAQWVESVIARDRENSQVPRRRFG